MKTIIFTQQEGETRKNYLLRMAMYYIKSHTGIVGMPDSIHYDESECDGYCLAEDLEIEFDVEQYENEPQAS